MQITSTGSYPQPTIQFPPITLLRRRTCPDREKRRPKGRTVHLPTPLVHLSARRFLNRLAANKFHILSTPPFHPPKASHNKNEQPRPFTSLPSPFAESQLHVLPSLNLSTLFLPPHTLPLPSPLIPQMSPTALINIPNCGAVQGTQTETQPTVAKFLNIPYATVPERWRPAVKAAPWSGVRDATIQG